MQSKAGGFHCLWLLIDWPTLSNLQLYAAITGAHTSREKQWTSSRYLQLAVRNQLHTISDVYPCTKQVIVSIFQQFKLNEIK